MDPDNLIQDSGRVDTDHATECLLNEDRLVDFGENPISLFQQWFQQAFRHGVLDPFIMSLATSSKDGLPSVRVVALGNVDDRGFYFATNLESRKAQEIKNNPNVATTFYWPKLNRTVRVEGAIEKVNDEGRTFRTWPRSLQIVEHSHLPVGQPSESRQELVETLEDLTAKFASIEEIPQPRLIQAFLIIPKSIEFLQDHVALPVDRVLFKRDSAGGRWHYVILNR